MMNFKLKQLLERAKLNIEWVFLVILVILGPNSVMAWLIFLLFAFIPGKLDSYKCSMKRGFSYLAFVVKESPPTSIATMIFFILITTTGINYDEAYHAIISLTFLSCGFAITPAARNFIKLEERDLFYCGLFILTASCLICSFNTISIYVNGALCSLVLSLYLILMLAVYRRRVREIELGDF